MKRFFKLFLCVLCVVALTFTFVACNETPNTPVDGVYIRVGNGTPRSTFPQ